MLQSCKRLKFLQAKNGVSWTHSPQQIANQKALDCECNCKHKFGSFVQGYDAKTPHNTVAERAVDSVCLGATDDNREAMNHCIQMPTGVTLEVKSP